MTEPRPLTPAEVDRLLSEWRRTGRRSWWCRLRDRLGRHAGF